MPNEKPNISVADRTDRMSQLTNILENILDGQTTADLEERRNRLPWPEFFMQTAMTMAERSTCHRRKVGAVAVKDKRIIATGYNGVPAGFPHCTSKTCIRSQLDIPSGQRHELCFALHAEQNLLIQASNFNITLEGAEIYCTTFPCTICSKLLIGAKIGALYYSEGYPDELSNYFIEYYRKFINKDFVLEHVPGQNLVKGICDETNIATEA